MRGLINKLLSESPAPSLRPIGPNRFVDFDLFFPPFAFIVAFDEQLVYLIYSAPFSP